MKNWEGEKRSQSVKKLKRIHFQTCDRNLFLVKEFRYHYPVFRTAENGKSSTVAGCLLVARSTRPVQCRTRASSSWSATWVSFGPLGKPILTPYVAICLLLNCLFCLNDRLVWQTKALKLELERRRFFTWKMGLTSTGGRMRQSKRWALHVHGKVYSERLFNCAIFTAAPYRTARRPRFVGGFCRV